MLILCVYFLVALAFESDLLQGAQSEFILDTVYLQQSNAIKYYVHYELSLA